MIKRNRRVKIGARYLMCNSNSVLSLYAPTKNIYFRLILVNLAFGGSDTTTNTTKSIHQEGGNGRVWGDIFHLYLQILYIAVDGA